MHVARFCLALALLGSGTLAQAETISIGALKDNTIYAGMTTALSNGAGDFIHTGRTQENRLRRGLIAFDIAAHLPANAVVTNVSLSLQMSQANDEAAVEASSLHRLLADWGEGTSDAPSGEGGGAAATIGDATWQHRFFTDVLWATEGGDFVPLPSASTDVSGVGTYVWTSAAMVADVQDWLGDPSNNFGWAIITGDEIALGAAKRFNSRTNPQAALRPSLAIDYVLVPEPGTGLLLVFGLSGVAIWRRRFVA